MMASERTSATSSTVISGSGLAMAKMIGWSAMDFTMALRHRAFHREAEEYVGAGQRLGERARLGFHGKARLPLVHAFGAAFVDDALGVAEDEVLGAETDRAQKFEASDAGRAGAVADKFRRFDLAAGEFERVDQAGGGDDRGAVLVVMEDRNVEQLAQLLLDDEAFRRLDVLEIDAAPALAEQFYAIDELVGIFGRNFEIDGIDIGEALEQDRFAFHHRLCRQRAAIAEAENGGAVGDHRDEIALGRVVVGLGFVLGDSEHRNGDAGRISKREVPLRRHRLGGHDFELSRAALAVK